MDSTNLCDTCRFSYRYCDGKPFFAQDSVNPEKYHSPHQVVECDRYEKKTNDAEKLTGTE
jgi:hypothetical protein